MEQKITRSTNFYFRQVKIKNQNNEQKSKTDFF